jgi:hypothetical protein
MKNQGTQINKWRLPHWAISFEKIYRRKNIFVQSKATDFMYLTELLIRRRTEIVPLRRASFCRVPLW